MVEFNDEFVKATCAIYNEIPVRQGKTFWHYGKDFRNHKALAWDISWEKHISSVLITKDELIGFMKITWVGSTGTITQILSMKSTSTSGRTMLLIAKAVEICEAEGKSHFIYGSFVYYDPNSTSDRVQATERF